MPVSAGFLDALADILHFVPGYRTRRMFGGAGVYSHDLMFALVLDDALYLKADDATAAEFEERGLEPFIYRDRNGREAPMSYRQAPEEVLEDPDAAREWVGRALAAAQRKKA
ncbi:TfoX/Sxy family protein [Phenylobacterium sp.]|jgi:DNA transformation protein|uniref:TfoX/Sxy family protein n=1 Tax=Phenylobacterium sp. TaxID=1871053 RepID=UPI002F923FF4